MTLTWMRSGCDGGGGGGGVVGVVAAARIQKN